MYIRISLLFVLIANLYFSQTTSSYREIDSLSYEAYSSNDYKAMKRITQLADENEITFYYLHLRSGIVAYQNEKYEFALKQFEKANQMNPRDTIGAAYLYYTYVFSGRNEEAESFLAKQDETFKNRIGYKSNALRSVIASVMTIQTPNIDNNSSKKMINNQVVAGETSLNGNVNGGNVGLNFLMHHRFHLNAQMTYYQSQSAFLEEFNLPQYRKLTNFKNNQFQYNLASKYLFKTGTILSGGLGVFRTNTSYALSNYNIGPQSWYTSTTNTLYKGNLLTIGVGQRWRRLYMNISYTSIKLYSETTKQTEFTLGVFPFQNNKMFVSISFIGINNGTSFIEKLSFKLFNNCWMDLGFSSGNLYNYATANGLVVYNSADPIKQEINAGLNLYFKKFDLSLGYSNQLKQSSYYQYQLNGDYTTDNYTYTSNNFIIATRWKF